MRSVGEDGSSSAAARSAISPTRWSRPPASASASARWRELRTRPDWAAAVADHHGWTRKLERARLAYRRRPQLRNAAVLAALAAQERFSVTELEKFAECSSAWFVERFLQPGEIDYTSLFQIASLDVPDLRDAPWTPIAPPRLDDADDLFEAIQAGDILVNHPYESFTDSVERFIETAAHDARTLAIKMTVYRVGDDTPFVRSLIKAAEAGKQVACVIELKARFDEARNLHWAAELERAGAHVTVGDFTLKTHAKVALVVRKEAGGLG